jgi:CheY-like chemotaxis protein
MKGRTILVVDDDQAITQVLAYALTEEGYTVLNAVDWASLELARTEQPQVILLDVMMPVLNGVEVSQRLRADPATAHIPIIAMSAHVRGPLPPGLLVDDWLAKPFTLDQLYRVIGRWEQSV